MTTAFIFVALQAMTMPISTPPIVSTRYDRATTAMPSVSTASIAEAQLWGGQDSARVDEMITIRRGSRSTVERIPKVKPSK